MQRKKEKEDKEKAQQEAKEKAEQEAKEKDLPLPSPEVNGQGDKKVETDEGGDQGIKEPEKEPVVKVKRAADAEPEMEAEEGLVLERETSGLRHLRRRPLEKDLTR